MQLPYASQGCRRHTRFRRSGTPLQRRDGRGPPARAARINIDRPGAARLYLRLQPGPGRVHQEAVAGKVFRDTQRLSIISGVVNLEEVIGPRAEFLDRRGSKALHGTLFRMPSELHRWIRPGSNRQAKARGTDCPRQRWRGRFAAKSSRLYRARRETLPSAFPGCQLQDLIAACRSQRSETAVAASAVEIVLV